MQVGCSPKITIGLKIAFNINRKAFYRFLVKLIEPQNCFYSLHNQKDMHKTKFNWHQNEALSKKASLVYLLKKNLAF